MKALKEADELVDEIRKRLKNMGVFESSSDARPQWDDFMLPFVRKVYFVFGFSSFLYFQKCGTLPFSLSNDLFFFSLFMLHF